MSTPPSKNQNVTRITIPTEQLRALLPEEAMVQIERIAIEKIGEEVRRKMVEKQASVEGIVRDVVASMVRKDMEDQTSNLSSTWRFPQAGKGVVEGLVKKYVEDTIRNTVVDAVAAVERKMVERLSAHLAKAEREVNEVAQRAVNVRLAEMDRRIAERSRAEFLAVLKEAKEAGL